MNSNQTSRTNRSNNSTGIAGALNPDADEQPRWDSRAAQYEQESSASAYPLSKMVGGGGHRTPGGESANSLAAYTSRRGVQTEERTTRPW
ncbi:hypothetical protein EON63_03290 [archaeon]|nr:MAG: hypothetical protein EON63_03290 [archaeon]